MAPLLDEFLLDYDVVERHWTDVALPPVRAWRVLRDADLSASPVTRALMALRRLGGGRSGAREPLTIDALVRRGFAMRLADRPPTGVVLGIVGKFWMLRPAGAPEGLRAERFTAFREPGWAKAAWSFEVHPLERGRSRIATETRVQCTDDASRRRFRRYWRVVGPFSALIRREMLRGIERDARRSVNRE